MRFFLRTIMTIALTLCFSWGFGHIQFSDNGAYALEKLGAGLGIYGIENLEDFYMAVTFAVSLIAALLIVWRVGRSIRTRQ